MNLSEKESAVFSRLSLSQREELINFPPDLRSRTLSILDSVSSSRYGAVIAKEKTGAMIMSIITDGKTPDWNVGYTERSDLRKLAELASFMPPVPEWMKEERERKRAEDVNKLAQAIPQFELIITSNWNGRGGFGD